MKFRDLNTGAILEPSNEFVAQQMVLNPNLVTVDEKPKAAPRKRAPRKTKATE